MVERPMVQHSLQIGRFSFWRLFAATSLALLVLGCGAAQRERTVSNVVVQETAPSAVDLDDLLDGLATAAPRKLLWVERERDVYDANLVARDLERVERFYRAQGYYDVKVVAARVTRVGERQVAIEVHVTPGPRVTVRKVTSDASAILELTPAARFEYKKVREPTPGQPFTESRLDRYEKELLATLKEAGYAYAKVDVRAIVDLDAGAADVGVVMKPGKPARIGEIRVVGLKQIPESKVRAALNIKTGDSYSEADQKDAQDALENMQLFTRVEVTPDLTNPEVADVPVLVTLQEDQLRKLTLGGGTIIDALKLEAHLRTGWEHKNFLGGARKLTIDVTGGVDLYPNRLENLDRLWVKPTNDFWIIDSSVALEQPAIFNGRTKGNIKAGFTRRPVLYSLDEGKDATRENVIGYNKPNAQIGVERSFLGQRIVVRPSYNVEARVPFMYQGERPAGLETVWVSYPRLFTLLQAFPGDISTDRNKRDFAISFRNTIELAGFKINGTRLVGGSVSDLKIEPELRGVAPLFPRRSHPDQRAGNLTIAGRLKFGFLIAPDYGDTLRTDQAAAIAEGEEAKAQTTRDQLRLLSRAFYSGGATSNRGYAQNAISPHGPVGFLVPTSINCNDPQHTNDTGCIRPLGGFTQWEASLELRYAALYPITIVLFADAADVSRDIGRLQFKYPHLSVGPGVRYESPVGPIRLDLGIRVPRAQAWGERELPADNSHGPPPGQQPELFGLPAALQLAIGDAF
jgi:outer membrane protein insertion porin family/translocation and assembly module TamA